MCSSDLGSDQLPYPQLAESWEASDDATEWVFNLRKGVEFHNGKTMTSADVVYNIHRHLGEDTESRIKAYMAQIVEVTADGDHRIRIKLNNPNSELPILFASARARSEEHTSELQSRRNLVCRLLLEKKKTNKTHCGSTALDILSPSRTSYTLTSHY